MRKLTLTVALSAVLGGAAGSTAQASKQTQYDVTRNAVCHFFKGSLCDTAMKIVKCETGGTYTPWSANGQYLGIFQMGSSERRQFGHGNNVWAQAKAAYAYYSAGHSFDPWLKYEPAGCAS
jgi:hypothetical protein